MGGSYFLSVNILKIVVIITLSMMLINNLTNNKTITEVLNTYKSVTEPEQESALANIDFLTGNSKIDANDEKLINFIQKNHLTPPSTSGNIEETPNIKNTTANHEQQTISRYVANYFKEKKEGFFIECGANDGVWYSNTLTLETRYNWKGLLIEADPQPYSRLLKSNRKAWMSNTCLSTTQYPSKVKMMRNKKMEGLSFLPGYLNFYRTPSELKEFEAQCFPLYSMLLAVNVTNVDYFSLDIEGAELSILKTIPWNKLSIRMISIEVHPQYERSVKEYMTSVGYKYLTFIKNRYSHDQIYVLE